MNPELQKLLTQDFLCPWCQIPMEPVTEEDNRMCKDCSLFLFNSGPNHSTLCVYLKDKYYIYYLYNTNQLQIASVNSSRNLNLTIDSRPPFPASKEELTKKLRLYLTFS